MVANNENHHENKRPSAHEDKIRNRDRRPKGLHRMRRRSICLSPELDRLVMNEKLRRNLPSVSALIEHAIEKEVAYNAPAGEASVLDELQMLRTAVHRLERESAERDVIQVELIAGLARAHFATVPQPSREEQQARIEQAQGTFDRFMDAVGRKIESGQTTLAQLPDVPTVDRPAEPCAEEKSRSPEPGEGAHNGGV